MTQTTLDFESRVPENPFTPGTQAFRLYEWLQATGEITLHEIHNVLRIDTARIRVDVKRFLRRNGFEVECSRLCEGNSLYRVTRGK
jgi:hypothetical protein